MDGRGVALVGLAWIESRESGTGGRRGLCECACAHVCALCVYIGLSACRCGMALRTGALPYAD